MTSPDNHFYEFGLFRVDAGKRLLLRDGEPLPLTPKAFDTLLVLVEKTLPWGSRTSRLTGALLGAWGVAVLLAAA